MGSLEEHPPLDLRLIRPRNPGPCYVEDDDDGGDDREGSCISCSDDEMLWLSDDEDDEDLEQDCVIPSVSKNSKSFRSRRDASFVEAEPYQVYYSKDHPPSSAPVQLVKPVPVRPLWDLPEDNEEQSQDGDGCCADDDWSVTESSPALLSNKDNSNNMMSSIPRFPTSTSLALQTARDGLLLALSAAGGRTDGHAFRQCLTTLHEHYQQTGLDTRFHNNGTTVNHKGTWLTLTQPVFQDCLGVNDQGDPLYTLGRMSFQMFQPAPLVCSLQGNFNCVQATNHVPAVLQDVLEPDDRSSCSTYNGLCAFTVEANHPQHPHQATNPIAVDHPCRGILATHGYMCADRHTPNRHTVWITSGTMHANDTAEDVQRWKTLFSKHHSTGGGGWFRTSASAPHSSPDFDKVDSNNYTQSYSFRRALGGHGVAYVDTLYLDPSLRIVRGHRGTLFVFSKLKASVQD